MPHDERAELLRGVLWGSFPFDTTERIAAMLYAYGDLSGTARNKVYVVAGYVGHETRWAALDQKWAKALALANVDHFHATDFFANKPRGPFEGWKKESKRWLAAERAFTSAALSVSMVGFARGIHTAGYPQLRTELEKAQAKQKVRSLRLFAAQMFLERLAVQNKRKPLAVKERIAAYFEDEQGMGEVPSFFTFSKKKRAAWTEKFITVAPLPKKEIRPLQVADLFAHAAWQRLEYGVDSLRPSQRQILESGQVEVLLMDEEELAKSAALIPAFLEQHPTGLVLPPRPTKAES